MDQRSPTFEATLLYKTALNPAHDILVGDVEDVMARHGEKLVSSERFDSGYVLIKGQETQILLAFSNEPLPIEPFLQALRPSDEDANGENVLEILTQAGGSATVLVLDGTENDMTWGKDHETLKEALCWSITEYLNRVFRPELVFWAETETLYSSKEFAKATTYCITYDAPVLPKPAITIQPARNGIPAFMQVEPMVSEAAEAWITGQEMCRIDSEFKGEDTDATQRSVFDFLFSYAGRKESYGKSAKRFEPRHLTNSFVLMTTMLSLSQTASALPI